MLRFRSSNRRWVFRVINWTCSDGGGSVVVMSRRLGKAAAGFAYPPDIPGAYRQSDKIARCLSATMSRQSTSAPRTTQIITLLEYVYRGLTMGLPVSPGAYTTWQLQCHIRLMMCGSEIWRTGEAYVLSQIHPTYNNIAKIITGLPKWPPMRFLLAEAGLPSPPHTSLAKNMRSGC